MDLHKKIYIRLRILLAGRLVMLQRRLLELALEEVGLHSQKLKITIDHINGRANVSGVEVGIVYPRQFFANAVNLPGEKMRDYYFNGAMPESGGRKQMLQPYVDRAESLIVSSIEGRNNRKKGQFNTDYYSGLRASRFTLCPHQADWPGPKETMWTYRFVEACIAKSIPIVFRETPLGDQFVNGFHFLWDDKEPHVYDEALAIKNRRLALERFTLSAEQHSAILDKLEV